MGMESLDTDEAFCNVEIVAVTQRMRLSRFSVKSYLGILPLRYGAFTHALFTTLIGIWIIYAPYHPVIVRQEGIFWWIYVFAAASVASTAFALGYLVVVSATIQNSAKKLMASFIISHVVLVSFAISIVLQTVPRRGESDGDGDGEMMMGMVSTAKLATERC